MFPCLTLFMYDVVNASALRRTTARSFFSCVIKCKGPVWAELEATMKKDLERPANSLLSRQSSPEPDTNVRESGTCSTICTRGIEAPAWVPNFPISFHIGGVCVLGSRGCTALWGARGLVGSWSSESVEIYLDEGEFTRRPLLPADGARLMIFSQQEKRRSIICVVGFVRSCSLLVVAVSTGAWCMGRPRRWGHSPARHRSLP